MRSITYQVAVLEALQEEFRRDGKTLYLAEHVNRPLRQEFGEARVRETPISESAFVGAAVGLAGSGFRPVVDIGMATFAFVAMDQIMNQAAKIHYMFGGQAKFPIVYQMTVGTGRSIGARALRQSVSDVHERARSQDHSAEHPLRCEGTLESSDKG